MKQNNIFKQLLIKASSICKSTNLEANQLALVDYMPNKSTAQVSVCDLEVNSLVF